MLRAVRPSLWARLDFWEGHGTIGEEGCGAGVGPAHGLCSALQAISSSTITVLSPMEVPKKRNRVPLRDGPVITPCLLSTRIITSGSTTSSTAFTTPVSRERNSYTWIRGGDYVVIPSK